MDIKSRIDGLTEQEAKDALEWYTQWLPGWLSCDDCPDRCRVCKPYRLDLLQKCADRILEYALREARK